MFRKRKPWKITSWHLSTCFFTHLDQEKKRKIQNPIHKSCERNKKRGGTKSKQQLGKSLPALLALPPQRLTQSCRF